MGENRMVLKLPVYHAEQDKHVCSKDCPQLQVSYQKTGWFSKERRAYCRGLGLELGVVATVAGWHSGALRSSMCLEFAKPVGSTISLLELLERVT